MYLEAPTLYPHLTQLVRGLAKRIPSDERVFEALKKYGEFTTEQATEALKWGTSPEIRVDELNPQTWGNTKNGADHFVLNQVIIFQFEQLNWASRNVTDPYLTEHWQRVERRKDWEALVARADLAIEALILHETVHWGDGQVYEGSHRDKSLHEDRAARRAGFEDRGHQFAYAAYKNRLPFTKNRKGIIFSDHDIDGWLGTVHLGGKKWGYWRPLSQEGPAPVVPPSRRASKQ